MNGYCSGSYTPKGSAATYTYEASWKTVLEAVEWKGSIARGFDMVARPGGTITPPSPPNEEHVRRAIEAVIVRLDRGEVT